jgi:acetylornithine deacetylase/succinyl-diaminopimelate desuccinylase-like protein
MENKIVHLLSELVRINSVNLTLSQGPGENEIAKFIRNRLEQLGIRSEIQAVTPDRSNVIAMVSGSTKRKSLLLNGHLDTVGVDGMDDPFILKQEGDRLYGRGAFDMKGSLAVMLLLAEYFTQHPPPLDIFFTFVADEEDKSIGMDYLVEKWLPHISPLPIGAIFLEPTDEDIGVSHKGFSWYELEVVGKAAHGSRPEEGIDAILPLRSALNELNVIQAELLAREPDPVLGHAIIHSSIIAGGTELSVIPSYSQLQWERRMLPGESQQELDMELERTVRAVENHPGNHEVKGRKLFLRPSYRVPDDAEILSRLQKASPQSSSVGFSFWADSALAGQAGIPSVLFGPNGHGAHAVDEWVSLQSLVKVYEVIKKVIMDC